MITDMDRLRKRLRRAYKRLRHEGGWRMVGKEFGINGTTACRMATSDYMPKDPEIRLILGLHVERLAPVCPVHGIVHVSHRRCRRRVSWVEEAAELLARLRKITLADGKAVEEGSGRIYGRGGKRITLP